MGVFYPYTVRLADGEEMVVELAIGVNVQRFPQMREKIIDKTFHTFRHPGTGKPFTVEVPFMYTDIERNAFFSVRPPKNRTEWNEHSVALAQVFDKVPAALSQPDTRHSRVVYGLAELREKLIAQDVGVDDRLVELVKVFLIHEHPFLIQKPRLRLMLDAIDEISAHFIAAFDHGQEAFDLAIDRENFDDLVAKQAELTGWVSKHHTSSNIFEEGDGGWVNLWRWSPSLGAVGTLRHMAALAASGEPVPTKDPRFKTMLQTLPRGNQLPTAAKRDLRSLQRYAKDKGLIDLEDSLFEIRFDKELEDDWSLNRDVTDIDTLWSLLRDLPDSNVEGNVKLSGLFLNVGESGGYYYPGTGNIEIGEHMLRDRESFEDVVRHEVGHAVHEKLKASIDPWLEQRFGWRSYSVFRREEVDQWVALMGGWGALSSQQQREVWGFLRTALGSRAGWDPGPTPSAPIAHPWNARDFGPRLAFEQSGSYWHNRNQNWFRRNGRAFFCNFYYKRLMSLDEATLDLINDKMPSKYAAMSPLEFFAELYALYYDLDDPQRGNVPADVMAWMDANIGQADMGGIDNDLGPAHRSGPPQS